MAEAGESGKGRMAEPLEIAGAVAKYFERYEKPLAGLRVLVTSGPTHEPIDPVRYIANRSSGKQGHAIAAAAARAGAEVTLVSGPVNVADPPGVKTVHVESAREMLDAVERALPAERRDLRRRGRRLAGRAGRQQKIKKQPGAAAPTLSLTENPDILSTIAHKTSGRPRLVIGFAAETENVAEHAKAKRARKGCDWILANDVSPATGIMGGDMNTIELVTADGIESWPPQTKEDVAAMLVERIAAALQEEQRERQNRRDHPAAARRGPAPAGLSERACRRARSVAAVPQDARSLSRPARASWCRPASLGATGGLRGPGTAALGARGQARPDRAESPGTIDADYRGEIQVLLVNLGSDSIIIKRGMRIAQLVVAPVTRISLSAVAALDATARGKRGIRLDRKLRKISFKLSLDGRPPVNYYHQCKLLQK